MVGYSNPRNLQEVFAAMLKSPYQLVAGGTDIIVRKNKGLLEFSHIINLLNVEELQGCTCGTDGSVHLGALVRHADLIKDGHCCKVARALTQASQEVGSLQIRNLATLGGNLCNASPAADTATPLLVLDASFELVSSQGTRQVKAVDFFVGPSQSCLQSGELLRAVLIPVSPVLACGSAFMKLAKRKALAIAVVNGAAWVQLEEVGGEIRIGQARVAMGSVAPTPVRLTALEAWLKGKPITATVLAEAGKLAETMVKPIDDIRSSAAYRRFGTAALVEKVLAEAVLHAKEGNYA